MKLKVTFLILMTAIGASLSVRATPIGITTLGSTYTQNFDTLANAGTSSTLPAGWASAETGTGANTTYTANNGSSTTGDTYSFGSARSSDSSDRALGAISSATFSSSFGVEFQNLTGGTLTSLLISYTGEQWGRAAGYSQDRLDFQYSLNATGVGDGSARWIDVNALDFTAPDPGRLAGALDGNATANRTLLSSAINLVGIASGTTFWLRWTEYNDTSADDALAVDNFSLTASRGIRPPSVPDSLPAGFVTLIFFFVLALGYRFRRQMANA